MAIELLRQTLASSLGCQSQISSLHPELPCAVGGYKTMSGVQLQSASPALTIQGSQKNEGSVTLATGAESKPKKKICCACPDTKRLRDECIVEHGEAACAKWIEAHRLLTRFASPSVHPAES
ncbi:Cytochrome c oxidase copper chaperone 1, partial [Mucuna pruriens]